MRIRVSAVVELDIFESEFPEDWTKERILACELKRASETIGIYDAEYYVELIDRDDGTSDDREEEFKETESDNEDQLPW